MICLFFVYSGTTIIVINNIITLQRSCYPASSSKRTYSPSPLRALVSSNYSNKHHHHQHVPVVVCIVSWCRQMRSLALRMIGIHTLRC